jgi:hypothetical protein
MAIKPSIIISEISCLIIFYSIQFTNNNLYIREIKSGNNHENEPGIPEP